MRIMILLGSLLVVGCDSRVAPPAVPKVATPQQGQDRLFDTQRQVLDKAKQLEITMQHDADVQRQALERDTK